MAEIIELKIKFFDKQIENLRKITISVSKN